jgi:hypothetical protein
VSSCRKSLVFAFFVAMACLAGAQANPLLKMEERPRAGWKPRLKIEVHQGAHVIVSGATVRISGTNVQFTVSGEFAPVTSEDPPGGPWTTMILGLRDRSLE